MKYLIALLTCLFLVACAQSVQPLTKNIHFGSQGIVFISIPDAPPKETVENANIPFIFRLENRGAFDVEYGRDWLGITRGQYHIQVSGQDSFFAQDTSARDVSYDYNVQNDVEGLSGSFSIPGKSLYNDIGGSQIIARQIRILSLQGKKEPQQVQIVPRLCYPYETVATANVCIDTDPFSIYQQARVLTCDYKTPIQLAGGQGGPVALTQVTASMDPAQMYDPSINEKRAVDGVMPRFTLKISRLATGRVVEQSRYADACEDRIDATLYDRLNVQATLSNVRMDCKPSPARIDYKTNSVEVQCTATEPIPKNRGNYQAPLQVTMSYGFVADQDPIEFTIKPLG